MRKKLIILLTLMLALSTALFFGCNKAPESNGGGGENQPEKTLDKTIGTPPRSTLNAAS
jgi:hypothetical protein